MIDRGSKYDTIVMQKFIDTIVGIPKFSYPAKKNAPRPKEEFCSIQLIEQYPLGLPITRNSVPLLHETTGEVIGEKQLKMTPVKLRYRVLMTDTTGIPAMKIYSGWNSEVIKDLMITEGYGFGHIHPISLEDAQLEKDWEPRQGFSVELYTTRYYSQDIVFIEYVTPIVGEYHKGNTVTDIEVNT